MLKVQDQARNSLPSTPISQGDGTSNSGTVACCKSNSHQIFDTRSHMNDSIDYQGENLRVELDNTQGSLPPVVLGARSDVALSQVWIYEEVPSE